MFYSLLVADPRNDTSSPTSSASAFVGCSGSIRKKRVVMNIATTYPDLSVVPLPIPIPRSAKPTPKMTATIPNTPNPAAGQPPPTIQPPSLASLSAMHTSTITTLVDLFNLALIHPTSSNASDTSGELEQAREKIRQLELELANVKAEQARHGMTQKITQIVSL